MAFKVCGVNCKRELRSTGTLFKSISYVRCSVKLNKLNIRPYMSFTFFKKSLGREEGLEKDIFDFYLSYNGLVDMKIRTILTISHCRTSDSQATVKASGFFV